MTESERVELRRAIDLLRQLPSGIDDEADADTTQPEDATAHIGGLVVRILERLVGA